MKPDEFLDLQAQEFYQMLDGTREEEKRQDQKKAYFMTLLINTQLQHPISIGTILKPLYPEIEEETEKARQEKRKNDEAYLKKEFGLK